MSVQNDGTSPPVQGTTETTDTSGTTNAGSGSGSGKTAGSYKTMDELLKNEPEFHKVVLMGMAQKMCQDMKAADTRLKKIQKGQS